MLDNNVVEKERTRLYLRILDCERLARLSPRQELPLVCPSLVLAATWESRKMVKKDGKVKKDTKAKAVEKKARKDAKQTKKAAHKEKKVQSKGAGDSDDDVVDLEAQLQEYAKEQARFLKVTEGICDAPSARASSSLIGSPSNANELFIFGGEFYDGALARFYNDLYVYSTNRGEWRKVTSPNSPLPRSGHAWCRGGNGGGIYLFGGEFSSPKQGTFHHYSDFWSLDPASREWTRIETKGKGPPARSGHRMTYYKDYILLFGGFQDTSQQTKYLQDLWIYDCRNYVWHNPVLAANAQKPDPRSSFSFLPHESGAVIYGGYSRVKATTASGKQTKGGSQAFRSILKPMVHQDTWFLRIAPPSAEAAANSPPAIRWERRKRPVNAPNPARAGATMAWHKGRGLLFGGVHDVEESEEGIDSEFFDALYAWNIDRNRFFQLALRRGRAQQTKKLPATERGGQRRGRGRADEEELLRNLAALETKGSIKDADAMEIDEVEMEDAPTMEHAVSMTMPHARFNAQLAVQGDTLYIFGGTYEHGDREFTFDEMYAIDLGRMDGVKQIYHREVANWVNSEDEESESDEEDDTDEDDMENEGVPLPKDGGESVATAVAEETPSETTAVEEEEDFGSALADDKPHPRPFESLREFFARTTGAWQEIVMEDVKRKGDDDAGQSIKELRKKAFALAEDKWWDCREEISALEEQQEQAGIGEMVSIADRGGGGGGDVGGLGRRR